MNVKSLIEDVIIDLSNNCSLESVTSKVQVVSRLLKNEKFKEWVDCEFVNGYKSVDNTPEYRSMYIVEVRASYLQTAGYGNILSCENQLIPIQNLGNKIYQEIAKINLTDTISIIQNSIKPNKNINLALGPHEVYYVQQLLENCQITKVYKVVSCQQFQRVVDKTKSLLLDFFIELNETVLNNEINFNVMEKKNEIETTINNTIYASVVNTGEGHIDVTGSTIIGGKDNHVTISSEIKQQLNSIVNEIESLIGEIEDKGGCITDAIENIRKELNDFNSTPKLLRLAFHALKGALSGCVESGVGILVEKAIQLLA